MSDSTSPATATVQATTTAPGAEPDAKRIPESRRAAKRVRKHDVKRAKDPHFELIQLLKVEWEQARPMELSRDKRKVHLDKILSLAGSKINTLVRRRDCSRVFQTVLKHGDTTHRGAVAKALKGHHVEMAREQFGRHLTEKLVKQGDKALRTEVLEEFRGHIASLLSHAIGAEVVETLFTEIATENQREVFLLEFYGAEYAHFGSGGLAAPSRKTAKAKTLKQILAEVSESKKKEILHHIEETLTRVVSKQKITRHSVVHRLMWTFFQNASQSQVVHMVDTFAENAVHFVHTPDGASVLNASLAICPPKLLKLIFRSFRGYEDKLATDEFGALVVQSALLQADDYKPMMQILNSLKDGMVDAVQNPFTCMALGALLEPEFSRFTPVFRKKILTLPENLKSIRKKDPAVRRTEFLKILSPALLSAVRANANDLLRSDNVCSLIVPAVIMNATIPEDEANSESSTWTRCAEDVAEAVGSEEDVEEDILTHFRGSRSLKKALMEEMVLEGGKREGASISFAAMLEESMRARMIEYAAAKGSRFVVAALLRHPATRERVLANLKGKDGKSILLKSTTQPQLRDIFKELFSSKWTLENDSMMQRSRSRKA